MLYTGNPTSFALKAGLKWEETEAGSALGCTAKYETKVK